jgi:hypothetical protein
LFSPVVEARMLAAGDQVAWIQDPATDVSNATALANPRPGVDAFVVLGRYEHVNFIWGPVPFKVSVTKVVSPEPTKLFAQAQQAVAFDGDLPPVELVLDAVDVHALARATPAAHLPAAVPRLGYRPRRAGLLPRHPPPSGTAGC